MKKVLLTLGIAVASSTMSFAQLPVGSTAPDFTLTDINGNIHHLQNYLDQGYTVVIDISAAWCGPCWAAHESGFMKNLYEQYGPTGTVEAGKVMVLYVEGESQNTTDQLMGIGSTPPQDYATGTQGDWVTGEPYPFIDDASLNSLYNLTGFPTFTVICPNGLVSYSTAGFGGSMGDVSYWNQFVGDCNSIETGINGKMINSTTAATTCSGSPTQLSSVIKNMGTENLTNAVINAIVDGQTVATTNWTGNISTLKSDTVNIGEYAFTGNANVTYEILAASDAQIEDNTFDKSIEIGKTSNYKDWKVEVKTDDYPAELAWGIFNSAGELVYVQQSYTEGQAQQVFEYPVSLDANECYTFVVVDQYGDGLTTGIAGYVKVKDDVGMIHDFGSNYGSGTSMAIQSGNLSTGLDDLFTNSQAISIFPNPTTNDLNVSFDLVKKSNVTFSIVNLLGQSMLEYNSTYSVGQNKATLSVSDLPSGIYFLNILTEEGSIQRKFVKE